VKVSTVQSAGASSMTGEGNGKRGCGRVGQFRLQVADLLLKVNVGLLRFHLLHPQFRVFAFKEADTVRLLGMLQGEARRKHGQTADRQPKRNEIVHGGTVPASGAGGQAGNGGGR